MAGPKDVYVKELYQRFGYLATWTPGTPIELGDVGLIRQNMFSRLTSLKSLGIEFVSRADSTEEDLSYVSEGGVETTFKAKGSLVPPGSSLAQGAAGIVVDFKNKSGVMFQAHGCTSPSIEDQLGLGRKLIQRYRTGSWNAGYAVVVEVVNANTFTTFISDTAGGKIELMVDADILPDFMSLANAESKLSVAFARGIHTQVLAQGRTTPLMRIRQITKSIFRGPQFRDINPLDRQLPMESDPEELAFEYVVPDFH